MVEEDQFVCQKGKWCLCDILEYLFSRDVSLSRVGLFGSGGGENFGDGGGFGKEIFGGVNKYFCGYEEEGMSC